MDKGKLFIPHIHFLIYENLLNRSIFMGNGFLIDILVETTLMFFTKTHGYDQGS